MSSALISKLTGFLTRYSRVSLALVMFAAGAGLGASYPKIKSSFARSAPGEIPRAVAATCPDPGKTLVVAAFGQSNAANYGGVTWAIPFWGTDHYKPKGPVFALDWKSGKCFVANDPLPGAEGQGSSIWGRFGDALIARGKAENVLILAFGVGGTSIADWTEPRPEKRTGERLDERLQKAASTLTGAGYRPDFIAFQQGESDVATSYADYRAAIALLAGRTEKLFGRPMTAAISTLCQQPSSPEIGRAIRDTAAEGLLRLGPDFDSELTHALDRMDRCHLSGLGLEKAARMWGEAFDAREIASAAPALR